MAYVRKMLAPDEKMIGIARLHWIYVIKGLIWFLALAGMGWLMNEAVTRGLFFLGTLTNSYALPATLLNFSHNIMLFMMGGGVLIFMMFVVKVLATEIALTTQHVIHKEGLLFVNVKQVDIVEILGESLDLGHLGRLLGYGYLHLDCRFIGDVNLPAIENPERFLRALHHARQPRDPLAEALDGKAEQHPEGAAVAMSGPDTPQPKTPQPTPEILPGQQPSEPEVAPPDTPNPEIRPTPVPHNPPPVTPPQQPMQPPAQPVQPVPPPYNPEPPLQPPSGVNAQQPIVPPVVAQNVKLAPEAVAQVVQQVMPQMAEQVVKQMAEQGLIHPEEPANDDIAIDTDLIDSFDDAAKLDKGGANDLRDKVEYAIH